MAVQDEGINQFGNGIGYLYISDLLETMVVSATPNNELGAKNARRHALINAPMAANRSAVATIAVTAAASAGNLTAVTISGVNQIGGNVACASSNTTVVAAQWAAVLNAYTPPSGYKYSYSSIANVIYVFAPHAAGSTVNGVAITISTSVGSLTATTTAFAGGSKNTGIIDDSVGYRYWLDADYGASGVAGSTPALPNPAVPFLYAIEITDFITRRGLETGLYTETNTVSSDSLLVTRKSSITNYKVQTQGGASSDYLVRVNPLDFVEGDVLVIWGLDSTKRTTVVDRTKAGAVSATANPNIILSNTSDFITSGPTGSSITLQFREDDTLGGVFVETTRTIGNGVQVGRTLVVSDVLGDDATAVRQNFITVYETIQGALADAASGDQVLVFPGTYVADDQFSFYDASGLVKIFCMPNVVLESSFSITLISNLYGYAQVNFTGSCTIAGDVQCQSIAAIGMGINTGYKNVKVWGDITLTKNGISTEGIAIRSDFNLSCHNIIVNITAGITTGAYGIIGLHNVAAADVTINVNDINISGDGAAMVGVSVDKTTGAFDSNVNININRISFLTNCPSATICAGVYLYNVTKVVGTSININIGEIDCRLLTVASQGVLAASCKNAVVTVGRILCGAGTVPVSVVDLGEGGGASEVTINANTYTYGANSRGANLYVDGGSILNFRGDNEYYEREFNVQGTNSQLNRGIGTGIDTGNTQNEGGQLGGTTVKLKMEFNNLYKRGSNKNILKMLDDSDVQFQATKFVNSDGATGTGKSIIAVAAANVRVISFASNIPFDSTVTPNVGTQLINQLIN